MKKPFIVADIGINHYGNFACAKSLIYAARDAGADAVKFQAFSPWELAPEGEGRESLMEVRLTAEQLWELREVAKGCLLSFGVTPFSLYWLYACADMADFIKIASGNADNEIFLKKAARMAARGDKKLIVSMGAAKSKNDVAGAIAEVQKHTKNVTFLACTSAYPTFIQDTNVKGMDTLREMGAKSVGFSCHCRSIYPAIAAAVLGAEVIEKHISFENQSSPDHRSSLTPDRFVELVVGVRAVVEALGDGEIGGRAVEAPVIDMIMKRREWSATPTL